MENKDANASKSVDLLQLFVHRYLEEYIEQYELEHQPAITAFPPLTTHPLSYLSTSPV
jgi:hypothetical protein